MERKKCLKRNKVHDRISQILRALVTDIGDARGIHLIDLSLAAKDLQAFVDEALDAAYEEGYEQGMEYDGNR